MRHLFALVLLMGIGVGAWTLPASTAPEPDPEVRTIIDKALERAAWAREQRFDTRYRHAMTQRTRKFDGDGDLADDETRLYSVEPVRGVPYPKLITKNGEPISGDDLAAEKQRWEEFLESLDKPDDDEDDEFDIAFNQELITRYTATLEGIRELRGRPTYVLGFEPKPGKLPVRRRIDHAMNRSRGEIWIDQATYEIARVSFELMDRVRLWWGILGSISDATGHFQREPIADDVWLATELDVYYHVRVLFSTNRRGETTQWSEFEPISAN